MGTIDYHKMQSEMIQIHFQNKDLPQGMTFEDWQTVMEQKLRKWYDVSQGETPILELTDFHLARGLTVLHRPSPRNPMPTPRSMLIAFEAASSAARCQRDHIRSGFFRRPWLSAHFTLELAVIVLFCLRYNCNRISDKFDAGQIFEMAKLFTSNFLQISAQGWPEVSRYAGVYERLLGPLLEAVFSASKNPEEHFGPSQDTELTELLYPGPAQLDKLRFGTRKQVVQEEHAPFDFSMFNFEEDLDFHMVGADTNGSADHLAGYELLDHALGVDDFGLTF